MSEIPENIPNPEGTDIKLSVQSISGEVLKKIQEALQTRAKILGRVKSYEMSSTPTRFTRNSTFVQSPYELNEISRASDVESFVMQSIRKHRTNILKESYEIYGTNEETVKYVKDRLFEIAIVSGIPTLQWVRELITNIITYHNGILILRRDSTRSSGSKIKIYGKTVEPIAGIFVGDILSMGVEIDKYSTPLRWKQKLQNSDGENGELILDALDVIHIPIDRKPGFVFGTPYLVPVMQDMQAHRKLEEISLVLAEKEAFPLYHYQVGTENQPATVYDDGSDEVSMVLAQLSTTPASGYIVSSQRHNITLLSRDKAAMDLKPLLEYFEARVLAGLSLSPMDLGRGGTANRSTGTLIGKNLEDSAKDYQSIIAECLTQYLILPLLLEGGYDVNLENMVYFKFPMIDREELRAHQNHGLQLFLSSAISLGELRKDYLNREEAMDEADTIMQKQLAADITLAKATPKPAASSSSKGSRSVARTVSNKSRPANQHGSTPKSRFKRTTASTYSEDISALLNNLKKDLLNIDGTSVELDSLVSNLLVSFVQKATALSTEILTEKIEEGFHSAGDQFIDISDQEVEEIGVRAISRFFTNFVSKSYWKVVNPYKSSLVNHLKQDADGNTSSYLVVKVFEVIAKDISSLLEDQIETAKRFGFAKFAKKAGYNKIDILDKNEEIVEQINISEIIYKALLPNNAHSDCFLRLPLENITSEDNKVD